ncbi:hypothetical protein [Hymenobacter properus]|uniref:Uncharacterized protein n=1 Tax=Hymenobacter properus TaxID=2791026 RepID=A0A931BE12_9BACT|nr:hypothetical protein [Hymenobacter properus]MBF9140826.1 hypothetical protein [Hymenobacter properus]MBR7719635.1 hypothetical protein [Microvirga sp. SRT04]
MQTAKPQRQPAPLDLSAAPVFYVTNNGRFCATFAAEYPALLAEVHRAITWEEAWAAHIAGHEIIVDRPGTQHCVLFTVARVHDGFRRMIALHYNTVIS